MSEEPKPKEESEIKRCQVCGSTDFLAPYLFKEMKERKLKPDDAEDYLQVQQVIAANENTLVLLPMGASIPVAVLYTDVCRKCHTMVARKIQITEATKKPQIQMPVGMPGMNRPRGN